MESCSLLKREVSVKRGVKNTPAFNRDFLLNSKLKENWKGRKVPALGFGGSLVSCDSNEQQLRWDLAHGTHSQEAVDLAVPSHGGGYSMCFHLHTFA